THCSLVASTAMLTVTEKRPEFMTVQHTSGPLHATRIPPLAPTEGKKAKLANREQRVSLTRNDEIEANVYS
ncbi:hypothetical protein Q6247_26825, partial [Klebsiella pneumoniae]